MTSRKYLSELGKESENKAFCGLWKKYERNLTLCTFFNYEDKMQNCDEMKRVGKIMTSAVVIVIISV